jgi:hypothetical protein
MNHALKVLSASVHHEDLLPILGKDYSPDHKDDIDFVPFRLTTPRPVRDSHFWYDCVILEIVPNIGHKTDSHAGTKSKDTTPSHAIYPGNPISAQTNPMQKEDSASDDFKYTEQQCSVNLPYYNESNELVVPEDQNIHYPKPCTGGFGALYPDSTTDGLAPSESSDHPTVQGKIANSFVRQP